MEIDVVDRAADNSIERSERKGMMAKLSKKIARDFATSKTKQKNSTGLIMSSA